MQTREFNFGVTSACVRSALVVTLPEVIACGTLEAARNLVLDAFRQQSLQGVIFDLSSITVMDCTDFHQLRAIAEMVHLLGARALLVGMQPGVAGHLLSNDVNIEGLEFGRELDEALDRLSNGPGVPPEMPVQSDA